MKNIKKCYKHIHYKIPPVINLKNEKKILNKKQKTIKVSTIEIKVEIKTQIILKWS